MTPAQVEVLHMIKGRRAELVATRVSRTQRRLLRRQEGEVRTLEMRFPGEKESHTSSHSCPPPPAHWNAHGISPTKVHYKEGLRNGKHKPETSQSLEGESAQHWGLSDL